MDPSAAQKAIENNSLTKFIDLARYKNFEPIMLLILILAVKVAWLQLSVQALRRLERH